MKRISVDSEPKPIELCTDYSSTQVYSVSALTLLPVICEPLPLYTPKNHGAIVKEGDSYLSIELFSEEHFTDMTLVKPYHYENRINFLKKKQPLLGVTILNEINVKATERHLKFECSGSISNLKTLLSTVLFTPKKSSTEILSAGAYSLFQKDAHTWEAKNRANAEEIIQFVTIKDSCDNLRLAQLGFLDQTADTATPDSNLDLHYYSRHYRLPSIHGYLLFDGRLANEDVTVRGAINALLIRNMSLLSSASGWKKTLTSLIFESNYSITDKIVNYFNNSPLKIAYSDFFPNLSIAITLRQIFVQNGIETVLIHEDYYNPGVVCDLRLTLTKGLIPSGWGQLASVIFSPVIRNNKRMLIKCISALKDNIELSLTQDVIHENLQKEIPFVYLGEVTSMFYRRKDFDFKN